MNFGEALTGNYTSGIFMYTIIQCIASCFTFSFIIYYMARLKFNIKYRIFALLFFMLFPIFPFYSVWLTKDILFTLCITLITIGVIELLRNKEIIKSKKYCIYMSLFLLLSMFFRKNGIYVAYILGIVLLIVNRKQWIKILLVFLIPIILFKTVDGPIREKLNIQDGSSLEKFSIPAQQMARIYKYEKNTLSEDEKNKIELYISDENIDALYDPLLSDPVKAKLNSKAINNNKIDFVKFCVKLAFKYPAKTIESFLCTTYRFYYLDNEIARGLGKYKEQSVYVINNMLPAEMEIKSNVNNISYINIIDKKMYENDIPVFSTFNASGIYIYSFIICIGYLIYTKRYKLILSFLPLFMVLATQLAGPVVDQRYSYSFFTCFSLMIGVTIYLKNSSKEKIN